MNENMRSTDSLPPSITPAIGQVITQFAKDTKQLLQENIWAEYLFGSYATNRQTPGSDIEYFSYCQTPDTRSPASSQWISVRLFVRI